MDLWLGVNVRDLPLSQLRKMDAAVSEVNCGMSIN